MDLNGLEFDFFKDLGDAASQLAYATNLTYVIFASVFGLLNCFFGCKLKKLWVTVIGFAAGFLAGFIPCILLIEGDSAAGIALAVGLAAGVLLALVAFKLYKVGIFIWNAFLTFASVSYLFGDKLEWLGIIVGVVAGVCVGILSVRYLRHVCIFSTSLNGGILVSKNVLTLSGVGNIWIIIAASLALAALGMFVQFRTTAPAGEEKSSVKKS